MRLKGNYIAEDLVAIFIYLCVIVITTEQFY